MTARVLSAPASTSLALPVTTPGHLVEIGFTSPYRASSRGTITWNGGIFIAAGFTVSGLGTAEVTLRFFDSDLTLTTIVLSEGIENRTVRLWGCAAEAPGYADVWPLFDGRGVGGDGATGNGALTIKAAGVARESPYIPRAYITKEAGFNWLPAAGKVITFGGEQFVLEEARG